MEEVKSKYGYENIDDKGTSSKDGFILFCVAIITGCVVFCTIQLIQIKKDIDKIELRTFMMRKY